MSDPENNPTIQAETITGEPLRCVHGIETFDINEWNEHCSDPANGHTESGQTPCALCGKIVFFDGLPYHPITPSGKNIKQTCDECKQSIAGTLTPNAEISVFPQEEKGGK